MFAALFVFGFLEINWSIYNKIYVLTIPIHFNLNEWENDTTEQNGVNCE